MCIQFYLFIFWISKQGLRSFTSIFLSSLNVLLSFKSVSGSSCHSQEQRGGVWSRKGNNIGRWLVFFSAQPECASLTDPWAPASADSLFKLWPRLQWREIYILYQLSFLLDITTFVNGTVVCFFDRKAVELQWDRNTKTELQEVGWCNSYCMQEMQHI